MDLLLNNKNVTKEDAQLLAGKIAEFQLQTEISY